MLLPLEILILLKERDFKRVLEAKTRERGPSASEVRKRKEEEVKKEEGAKGWKEAWCEQSAVGETGLSLIIFASPTRNRGTQR